MTDALFIAQVADGIDLTLKLLLIVLITLSIVVIFFIGAMLLAIYIKVNRILGRINSFLSFFPDLNDATKMATFFSGLGATGYGFISGMVNKFPGRDNKKNQDE